MHRGPAGRWGGRPGPTWQEEVPERRERGAGLKPMFEKGAGDSGREGAAGTGDGDRDRDRVTVAGREYRVTVVGTVSWRVYNNE